MAIGVASERVDDPIRASRPAFSLVVSQRLACSALCLSQKAMAYRTLRVERMNVRQVGPRKKKAEEAAKEEAVSNPFSLFTLRHRVLSPLHNLNDSLNTSCLSSYRRRRSKHFRHSLLGLVASSSDFYSEPFA